jgi:hypothetical protein
MLRFLNYFGEMEILDSFQTHLVNSCKLSNFQSCYVLKGKDVAQEKTELMACLKIKLA